MKHASPQAEVGQSESRSAAPAEGTRTGAKPRAALLAEYEALKNDLGQANALAAELQVQLSAKSSEIAEMKRVLAQTQDDMARLQLAINQLRHDREQLSNKMLKQVATYERRLGAVPAEEHPLRQELARMQTVFERVTRERHQLANEVLKQAGSYERKLAADLAERQSLYTEIEALKRARADIEETVETELAWKDKKIATLTVQVEQLRAQIVEKSKSGEWLRSLIATSPLLAGGSSTASSAFCG